MDKKTLIILIISICVVIIGSLFCFYSFSIDNVSDDTTEILFTIDSGTSSKSVIDNLDSTGLVNNKLGVYAYYKLHSSLSFQAGTYSLNKTMNIKEIFNKFDKGEVVEQVVQITFVEGKRFNKYVNMISEGFDYTPEEINAVINDKDYLNELINKYWFLTDDILNDDIYSPLEGYLYPDTYLFDVNSTIKQIIEKILDNTESRLSDYKDQMTSSEYSIHEIMSMASIIELEANSEDDRMGISQVIYKRLNMGMSLGMDVTTYYAVEKDMGEVLTAADLATVNAYNTRDDINMAGKLPIGPICNPSLVSINAVFNPSDTDYIYFYADITTGDVHFAKDYSEFLAIIKEVGR